MTHRLRTSIVQPGVPGYRVPVFARLARVEGLHVKVFSAPDGAVPEAEAKGFSYGLVSAYSFLNGGVTWIPSEIQLATRYESDVLVLPWNLRILSTLPALLRANRNKVGTILWGHGYSRRSRNMITTLLRNLLARAADAVMVYDHHTASLLRSQLGHRTPVFVAPNALNQTLIHGQRERLAAHPELLEAFAERHALGDRQIVLHVSRLIPARRLDVLVKAMGYLRDSHPNALLVIIGDGPARNGLQQLVNSMGLAASIRFMPSTYEESELGPWFSLANAYCFPEGIGLSIFHAMGYGVPIIIGDDLNQHWPEARCVRWGENAIGFRHGQPQDLAQELGELLTNRELRNKLANGGLHTVEREFNVSTMVRGMTTAIQSVGR